MNYLMVMCSFIDHKVIFKNTRALLDYCVMCELEVTGFDNICKLQHVKFFEKRARCSLILSNDISLTAFFYRGMVCSKAFSFLRQSWQPHLK